MSFSTITARLVSILETNRGSLVDGMLDRGLAIEASYAYAHFSPQVLFVYRDGSRDIDHGSITGPGTGASAAGEIEGRSDWVLAAYLRYTGNEEVAAQELDKLAWNVITVMAGYTADATNAYMACMFTGSTSDYRQYGTESPWYVGELFRYSVSWDLTF
jgi:hypothetical protein